MGRPPGGVNCSSQGGAYRRCETGKVGIAATTALFSVNDRKISFHKHSLEIDFRISSWGLGF